MKKIFILGMLLLCGCGIILAEETTVQEFETGNPTVMETLSEKTSDAAKKAGSAIKAGSVKATDATGKALKKGAYKTGDAIKSGAQKAGNATKKGATKATNFTAKGVKHTAQKIEKGADKVIDNTDKKIKCGCESKVEPEENSEEK